MNSLNGAAGAWIGPPKNDEAEATGGSLGLWDQSKTNAQDRSELAAHDQAATEQHKAFSTLQAKFAIAGFGLHAMSDGSFLACRWNLSRPLPSLAAAGVFLRMVGGARG
ncbi:MAG TPA: hypothetical protein VF453_09455 [Burkholderiaceae bacterium]